MRRRKNKAGEVGREGLGAGPATHANEGHGGLGPSDQQPINRPLHTEAVLLTALLTPTLQLMPGEV